MDELRPVAFRFQVSDRTLLSVSRMLMVQRFGIGASLPIAEPSTLPPNCDGLMLRSIPSENIEPGVTLSSVGGKPALRYVMQCFPRYYIDMEQTFDSYKQKFSGKTLSTIRRKVKKFADHTGGQIRWERFSRPEELERFWTLARNLSSKTYQEQLLDAGLPSSPSYYLNARQLAERNDLRAFLLFDRERVVSYLFCPIEGGTVQYAYLGYDPAYLRFSAGTVLQWLALESLFSECRYRYFDFTEGASEHKRLFATHHSNCANIALLTPTLKNKMLAQTHCNFNRAVESLGRWLDRHNLRARLRRWLRFGHAATQ